jgi:endoglucanase
MNSKKDILLSLVIVAVLFLLVRAGNIYFSKKIKVSPPAAPAINGKPMPATPPVSLEWGAYVGDGIANLAAFESLVGKKTNILADFESWDANFPSRFLPSVGQAGKTLVVFWEPSFGYDNINDGSKDPYIYQFAVDAKTYTYPVILVPFDEMNLNESAWGYGANQNTADKFTTAWRHVHDIFASVGAENVKFAIDYNNVSIPNTPDNTFAVYYPGRDYVDYVGVDGFNFGTPWQSFGQIFDGAISQLSLYKKPIYIFSTASIAGNQKASWIADMGVQLKKYSNIAGWVWFNSNSDQNWLINTDPNSLAAFKNIVP